MANGLVLFPYLTYSMERGEAEEADAMGTEASRGEAGWSIFIGLFVVAAMSVGAWFLSPKGENQVLWRSSLILAFSCCYLMWAITFLAQLNPLIEPRRSDLRAAFIHE
ncbi:V-type H+-transporting ATPase subunit H [Sporothrix schenckii 1099-18]|uniref:V-type H+-transporting ATPase subunit H n=1 Tax=Sporothrix schenckii 1099-18 TaxID=1397361 RepID=A0A0F2M269_SPOSC|nr:V-type H+-transporting ATPase subunit H [Sporothrix schenckii 1099-18]KJR82231.1 V-type H+-transporting ATPase subunit H [Sporothrix schenckii 1099-18]